MHRLGHTHGHVNLSGSETPSSAPSKKDVDFTSLTAQAISLGLTPVQAFVLSPVAASPDGPNHARKQPRQKKSNASRTASARAVWREKGFNQLVLTVPDTEDIRAAFRAIEAELKNGKSWSSALYRDQAVASVLASNDALIQQLSSMQGLLEKTKQELKAARLLVEHGSGMTLTGAAVGVVRAIVGSIFGRRRFVAK